MDFRSGERELTQDELLNVVAGVPRDVAIKKMQEHSDLLREEQESILRKEAEMLQQAALEEQITEEVESVRTK